MRKVILLITSIILCLSVISLCYFASQYKNYSFIKDKGKDISKIEEKIKKIDKDINTKKSEVEKLKEENKEKVELLEVWEKESEKVKEQETS